MKCCRLCWLLKECLNKKSNSSVRFDLPGTHGTYYAWIPPPGVPDEVLRDLRDELVRVVYANLDRQVTHQEKYFFPWQTRNPGGHPPQSSGISGNLGLHEVYQGAQALQGTPGFPRVTEAL